MALKKMEYIGGFHPMALKDGKKYTNETGEAFRDLMGAFFVCTHCRSVFFFNDPSELPDACVVCRVIS